MDLQIRVFMNPLFGEPVVCTRITVFFIVSVVSVIAANPALSSLLVVD